MNNKISSAINILVGMFFLFATVFAFFSLMHFFNIPLPSFITNVIDASILYCIQPFFIFFEDFLDVTIGIIGEYFIYFSIFTLLLLSFVFSIALSMRKIQNFRCGSLTIFVEVLDIINIVYALIVVILYLVIGTFHFIILAPCLFIIFISSLSFVSNILSQKKHM